MGDIHSFYNKSNIRRTLGGGENQEEVLPGGSISFDIDNLVANDIGEVTEGFLVATPPLPQTVLDLGDESANVAKTRRQLKKFVNQIKFKDDATPILGEKDAPQDVEINAVSGNGAIIEYDDSEVNVAVLEGTGTIAEDNPIKMVDGVAIISVTPTAVGLLKLGLSNGPAGIKADSELEIETP